MPSIQCATCQCTRAPICGPLILQIDVTWFPYDMQTCLMKFGLWTYTGKYVDLQFLPWISVEHVPVSNTVSIKYRNE